MKIITTHSSNKNIRNKKSNIDRDSEDYIILLDKFKIDRYCFNLVKSRFEKMYPTLLENVEYTWQELLGESFWEAISGLPDHVASICLQHLASEPNSRLITSPYFYFNSTLFEIRSNSEMQ